MEVKKVFKKIKGKILKINQLNKAFSYKDKKRLRKLPRYEPTKVLFYGKVLSVPDALTFLGSYNEIFIQEIYKLAIDKKDITIIDCGANIGLATIYLKMIFPDAHIVAFEPDPDLFKALEENVSSFGYTNVICKNEAVSDRDATLNFWLEGGHSGMILDDDDFRESTKVKAIRLKSFLNTYTDITFLKVDIEGEEVKVITDIADEIKKIDFLFFEYHSFIGKDQNLGKLLDFIREAGMRYYIKEGVDKSSPFINKELFLNMDMLLNIFCYR